MSDRPKRSVQDWVNFGDHLDLLEFAGFGDFFDPQFDPLGFYDEAARVSSFQKL